MENKFIKATTAKKHKKLRLFLRGPAGAGKTYSALLIAKGLGGKIALLDTEALSSTHYSDLVDYDVLNFNELYTSHKPANYIEVVEMAQAAGYSTLIIDSFSHAWMGHGGILEINDFIANSKFRGNGFAAWNVTTPDYYMPLINKILFENDLNIIATGRTKTEYEIGKDDKGKTRIDKLGSKTVQREGLEYEFDTILDLQHKTGGIGVPDKDRTRVIPEEGEKLTVETGKRFLKYFNS